MGKCPPGYIYKARYASCSITSHHRKKNPNAKSSVSPDYGEVRRAAAGQYAKNQKRKDSIKKADQDYKRTRRSKTTTRHYDDINTHTGSSRSGTYKKRVNESRSSWDKRRRRGDRSTYK